MMKVTNVSKYISITNLNISENIQVTHSLDVNHARSESVVSINPFNKDNLVAASKRFRNLQTYDFTVEAAVSFDQGQTWAASPLELLSDWGVGAGMSDPTIAWDSHGWVYLFVGPHRRSINPHDAVGSPSEQHFFGLWVYISKNGGSSWEKPIQISDNFDDDKQWAASDLNQDSPYFGNVYVAWASNAPLRFGSSRNPGAAWVGPDNTNPAQSSLDDHAFAPEVSVGVDGTIYIFWHNDGSDAIQLAKSTDGGQNFRVLPDVVKGISSIRGHAPALVLNGWPYFPGGNFRVITLVTACVLDFNTLIVAWADYRDGVSRIYYRRSTDGGENWEGDDASGQPLLKGIVESAADAHEFHPQILALPDGTVGCAFYEFGPRGVSGDLIDVVLAVSLDRGVDFSVRGSVTDKPWNPAINSPWAHGDQNVTFIGEYFGLDADENNFRIVWTDTRTGMQELFTAQTNIKTFSQEIETESSDTVFIPLDGSDGGGLLVNLRTGEVTPVHPKWDRETMTRNRTNTIRDTEIQKLDRQLDAFAISEGISDVTAQSVKAKIMDNIQLFIEK